MSSQNGVTEVVIPPRSPLIGTKVYPGMATPDGDLVILAARRGDDELKGQGIIVIQAGDALLLQGSWDDLTRHAESAGVLVVDSPAQLRRSVPLGRGAKRAIVVLAAMVALLATGVVPPAVAGLLAAVALVVTRTVSPAQAYRSISWTTVVLIAGMIPLSTAFIETGTADLVAGWLLVDHRRREPVRRARGALRADARARSAHQQHRDGADPGARRDLGRHRAGACRCSRS